VPDRLAQLGLPVLVIFGSRDRRWLILKTIAIIGISTTASTWRFKSRLWRRCLPIGTFQRFARSGLVEPYGFDLDVDELFESGLSYLLDGFQPAVGKCHTTLMRRLRRCGYRVRRAVQSRAMIGLPFSAITWARQAGSRRISLPGRHVPAVLESSVGDALGNKTNRDSPKRRPLNTSLNTSSPHPLARPEPADLGWTVSCETPDWQVRQLAKCSSNSRRSAGDSAPQHVCRIPLGELVRNCVHSGVTPFTWRANLRVLSPWCRRDLTVPSGIRSRAEISAIDLPS
jgi:hypothetical protein